MRAPAASAVQEEPAEAQAEPVVPAETRRSRRWAPGATVVPEASAAAARTVPPNGMRTFLHVLVNTAAANITTSYLWFALTFWVYLETRSVLATAFIGGSYMLLIAVVGVPFGTWVDRTRKKRVMVVAQLVTTAAFALAVSLYLVTPRAELLRIGGWQFALLLASCWSARWSNRLATSRCRPASPC